MATNEKWVLHRMRANVLYEKRTKKPNRDRTGRREIIQLYMTREYVADLSLNDNEEDPSIAQILQKVVIILPGGTSMRVTLPSLNTDTSGVSEDNPGGGEWKVRGGARGFDENTNRWRTTVRISGMWSKKIRLGVYNVTNWEL